MYTVLTSTKSVLNNNCKRQRAWLAQGHEFHNKVEIHTWVSLFLFQHLGHYLWYLIFGKPRMESPLCQISLLSTFVLVSFG